MRLISSKDTIDFLSQTAPRPWVGRMLSWMVLQWELDVYFETARVQPSTSAFGFLLRHREEAGEYSGPKMDQVLRREYDPELAEKLVGKSETDTILDEPTLLDVKDDPTSLGSGPIKTLASGQIG